MVKGEGCPGGSGGEGGGAQLQLNPVMYSAWPPPPPTTYLNSRLVSSVVSVIVSVTLVCDDVSAEYQLKGVGYNAGCQDAQRWP